MVPLILCLQCASVSGAAPALSPEPGTIARYAVLTGKVSAPPPFAGVDLVYGPREDGGLWWQLSVRPAAKEGEAPPPLFRLRILSAADPAADRGPGASLGVRRYVLRIPATGET